MKKISSIQNPLIKNLRLLKKSSKVRKEQGLTLLDGIHLAQSCLEAGILPESCLLSESIIKTLEVDSIINKCESLGIKILSLPEKIFKTLSIVKNGSGVILVIKIPTNNMTAQIKNDAVLIDGLQDPGNLGAILRTAAGAGIKDIYCSLGTVSAWSPKTLRAGMGAHFALNIYEDSNLAEIIQQSIIPILATTLNAKTTIYETDLSGSTAWLMGSEGQGISNALLAQRIKPLRIPQTSDVESLNVAAASAICLFEQRRQRLHNCRSLR